MWDGSNYLRYTSYLLIIITKISIFVLVTGASSQIRCPVQSLYQLGDSISDTGNAIRLFPISPSSRLPYGKTFPGSPTGRWSDGRLVIDYIAMGLGLPLLNPELAITASFNNGVNFAYAGSTALNTTFFLTKGIFSLPVPSLSVQLRSFRRYLNSICSTPSECANTLSRSLVFIGEFGYNDIGYAIRDGRLSIQDIYNYIPLVTQAILNATREVIEVGASQVVVPGNFPLGCFPFYLSYAGSNNSAAYDDNGCLKSVNNLTIFQNNGLQRGLGSLRTEFPNATILYADYYNAFQSLLRDASNFGFDNKTLLKYCCGADEQFDMFSLTFCGNPLAPVCPNPSKYIHWDGIHLTQAAHLHLSKFVINNLGINCSVGI